MRDAPGRNLGSYPRGARHARAELQVCYAYRTPEWACARLNVDCGPFIRT